MKIGISAFAWTGSSGAEHLLLLLRVRHYGFTGLEKSYLRSQAGSLVLTIVSGGEREARLDP